MPSCTTYVANQLFNYSGYDYIVTYITGNVSTPVTDAEEPSYTTE